MGRKGIIRIDPANPPPAGMLNSVEGLFVDIDGMEHLIAPLRQTAVGAEVHFVPTRTFEPRPGGIVQVYRLVYGTDAADVARMIEEATATTECVMTSLMPQGHPAPVAALLHKSCGCVVGLCQSCWDGSVAQGYVAAYCVLCNRFDGYGYYEPVTPS